MTISGVRTYIWLDNEALEAAEFYTSIFPESQITSIDYYKDHPLKPAGSVLTVEFEIFGQPFATLNGGTQFTHSEAVSFQVFGETQEEIDYLWNAITSNGGSESQCGWCRDKFGVSWQVIPTELQTLLTHPDENISTKAWTSMMEMSKIVIADLY